MGIIYPNSPNWNPQQISCGENLSSKVTISTLVPILPRIIWAIVHGDS